VGENVHNVYFYIKVKLFLYTYWDTRIHHFVFHIFLDIFIQAQTIANQIQFREKSPLLQPNATFFFPVELLLLKHVLPKFSGNLASS